MSGCGWRIRSGCCSTIFQCMDPVEHGAKHRVSALAVIAERKYLRETACAFYAMANKTDPWQKAGINIGLTDFAGTGKEGHRFYCVLVQRHDRALSKVAKRYQLE